MNDLNAWAENMFPDVKMPESTPKAKGVQFRTYQTQVAKLDIYFLANDERHARTIAAHLRGTPPVLITSLYSN